VLSSIELAIDMSRKTGFDSRPIPPCWARSAVSRRQSASGFSEDLGDTRRQAANRCGGAGVATGPNGQDARGRDLDVVDVRKSLRPCS